MKIAFLNIYNGIVERGSEVFVDNMAEKLSKNHEAWVFQTGESIKKNYRAQIIKGIPLRPHQRFEPTNGSFSRFARFLASLGMTSINRFIDNQIYHLIVLLFTLKCLSYLWREKFDWIIPINGRWQVVLCRLTRFFRGSKILISGHAGIGFEDKLNIVFGKPDIFVALTPTAYDWAKKISAKVKITYIPNGIDLKLFDSSVPPLHLPLNMPIIICVSALLAYKRIDLLIKAVSKLEKTSLLIIGDGSFKDDISSLGKTVLDDRFLLINHVLHSDLPKYYNASNIFSLASESTEAFGLVYLEAMACNLPVVASDDENRREVIDGAGFFVDPTNIEEYANVLNKALNYNFGNKPRKQAEKYSWEIIAKKYEEIFEKN